MSGKIRRKTLKDGSVRFYAAINHDGREVALGSYKNKRNAETVVRRAEAEIAAGTFGKRDAQAPPTFGGLAHKWLNDVARLKVKPSTLARYKVDVDRHLCPYFGATELTEITAERIDTFKAGKVDAGSSPRSVNSMLKQLGAIMKYALRLDYITRNPMDHVDMVKVVSEEMDYFTAPEVRRLLDAVPPKDYALFATAVLTGVREGELLALRWSDFDPGMNALYVRRTYHPDWGETPPKSKAGTRAVQVSPELIEILSQHRSISSYNSGDDLIFPNKVGKHQDYHNITGRVFFDSLDKAGLRRIRFHDLRHTYAAMCISKNVNFKWLQRQMGHASITTTMDTYGHIMPEVEEKLGCKLDSLLFDEKVVPFEKPVAKG